MTDPENPRWVKAKNSAIENLKAKGFEVLAEQKKAQTDMNAWIMSQIDNSKIDALLLAPTDDAASEPIRHANENNGIPVIAYDKLIHSISDNYNWYVTFDSEEVGRLQGLSFLSKIYNYQEPGENKDNIFDDENTMLAWVKEHKLSSRKIYATVGGDPKDNNARLFYNPALDLIRKAEAIDPNLTNARELESSQRGKVDGFDLAGTLSWDYGKGKEKIDALLGDIIDNKHVKADEIIGVLCPNDEMANVIIEALKGKNITNYVVTGLDANKVAYDHIKEGRQFMTIYKPDDYTTKVAAVMFDAIYKKNGNSFTNAKDLSVEEMKKALDAAKLGFEYKIDDKNYIAKTGSGKTDKTKIIKTILLKPIVITKGNLKVIEKYVGK